MVLVLLILLNSISVNAQYYFDCGKTKSALEMIQKNILNDENKEGTKLSTMQDEYDSAQARLVLFKGMQEIISNYYRANRALKTEINEKTLDGASKATRKTIITEETLNRIKEKDSTLELEDCDKSSKELVCQSFDELGGNKYREDRRTAAGLTRNIRFVKNKGQTLKELKESSNQLPSLKDRKKALQLIDELRFEVQALKNCQTECENKRRLIQFKKDQLEKNISSATKEESPQEKVGSLHLLKNHSNVLGSSPTSKILESRIKNSVIHAQLKSKLRSNSRSKKDKKLFNLDLREVYQLAFTELGCKGELSENSINQCLDGLNSDDKLDKLIGSEEEKLSQITERINSLTNSPSHKDMVNMKDSLIAYNLKNCRETKKDGKIRDFTICDPPNPFNGLKKPTKFALDTGKIIAYLDNEEKTKNTTMKSTSQDLMSVCSTPSNAKSVESLKILMCPKEALKLSKKREEGKKGISKSYKKEEKEFNWAGLYANNYVERDEYGNIISIVKKPKTVDYLMPNLIRGMNEMVPVGTHYIASKSYLDVMAKQAKQQNIINSYRSISPYKTFLWDLGYRGFDPNYIGGPTPWFPGTTGIGSLGRTNTYAGMGIYIPYAGQYGGRWIQGQLNPLNYSTFQFGAQYTYGH